MALVEFENNTAPYLNAENLNKIQEANIYSNNEIEIGKWIDDKPIYRKVIDCGALPNNAEKDINHNISNIDLIVTLKGFSYNSSNNFIPLPHANVFDASYGVELYSGTTNIVIITQSNMEQYTNTYVVIEYTKTTD